MGLVLAESLRAADSLYPLHALITDSLSARSIELLTRAGSNSILFSSLSLVIFSHEKTQLGVKPVKVTTTPLPPNVQPWREYWRDTYLKLNLWSFEEYERIIYLDADSIVMQNIDPLFQFHGEYHAATGFFFRLSFQIHSFFFLDFHLFQVSPPLLFIFSFFLQTDICVNTK